MKNMKSRKIFMVIVLMAGLGLSVSGQKKSQNNEPAPTKSEL